MSDWNLPILADPYSNFLDSLKVRDYDAISLGLNTITNPQSGMMRYVRASNKFQEYDGANWVDKVLSVAGGGTGSSTPAGAIGALGLGTMAVQNANAVNIIGGVISGLNGLTVNGGLTVAGASNLVGNVQLSQDLAISGSTYMNSLTAYGVAQIYGAVHLLAGLTVDVDIAVSRDIAISRNGAIYGALTVNGQTQVGSFTTGGTIYSAGLIHGASDISADRDVSAGRNINGVNLVASNNITATNDISAGKNVIASVDVIATSQIRARYSILAGPNDRQITNPADGTVLSQQIGYGWSGAGTKVLMDDNSWHDIKTVAGGGVVQILHLGVNFPEGVNVVTVNLGWVVPPPDNTRMVAQFDMYGLANDSYRFEFIGPTQINVWKTNPTLLTTNMWFTVIQYRTDH